MLLLNDVLISVDDICAAALVQFLNNRCSKGCWYGKILSWGICTNVIDIFKN